MMHILSDEDTTRSLPNKFMHVHLLLSTKCSSKSHLLEQLLTVLADPLLLVVARDVVPHRFILPKSSGKCKAALLSTQNCVGFYELSQPLFSIVWLPHPLVPRGRVVLTSLASSATETICPPGVRSPSFLWPISWSHANTRAAPEPCVDKSWLERCSGEASLPHRLITDVSTGPDKRRFPALHPPPHLVPLPFRLQAHQGHTALLTPLACSSKISHNCIHLCPFGAGLRRFCLRLVKEGRLPRVDIVVASVRKVGLSLFAKVEVLAGNKRDREEEQF